MAADERLFRPRELLAVLQRHDVSYVLIGGFAALIHGSAVQTNDVDICPSRDDRNLKRLASALAELEARIATPDAPEGVAFPHDSEFIGRGGKPRQGPAGATDPPPTPRAHRRSGAGVGLR